MKQIFKSILTLITGIFISKSVNSKELEVNQRVESIRKALSGEQTKQDDSNLLTYYKTLKEENDNIVENSEKRELGISMNWHNNPNWNQTSWNNYWNQVSWKNWNKKIY